MGRFSDALRYWKPAIKQFLKDRPELLLSNTRGYFRFLDEHCGVLPPEVADKLCSYDAQKKLIRPETFVRARRELIESGQLRLTPEQKKLLQDEEDDTRDYYRLGHVRRRGVQLWH